MSMRKSAIWTTVAGLLLPVVNVAAQEPEPPKQREEAPKQREEAQQQREEESKPRGRLERSMEKVAFLGVAVAPAPPSLRAQLGLAEGTGLLVLHVEPQSAAVGKLAEHDVLMRFNDQVLVNQDQLTVLVQNAGIGSEVRLTLLRAKNEETVTLALGEREVPKGMIGLPRFGFYGEWRPDEPWYRKHEEVLRGMRENLGEFRDRAEDRGRDWRERREMRKDPDEGREPAEGSESGRDQPGREDAGRPPLVKQSTWVENDLILNLVQTGDGKRLTVHKGGQKVFEGPVDTEEQRQKVPQEFRDKLDKMGSEPAEKEKADRGNIL